MPTTETVEKFIARVVEGAHAEAIAEFYAPNASMQENLNSPRVGRETLVAHERAALSRVLSVQSACVRPVLVNDDCVAIRWVFVFTWHDGRKTRIEEIAHQRWEGERIVAETFFYDPAQLKTFVPVESESTSKQRSE